MSLSPSNSSDSPGIFNSFDELSNEFLRMEDDLNLLSKTISGSYFWERIRPRVHRRLAAGNGLKTDSPGDSHAYGDYVAGTKLLLKNIVYRNPYLTSSHDVIYYGTGRRKKLPDGYWWDVYIDPILQDIDHDYQYFEIPHEVTHFSPAKTNGRRYTDVIEYIGTLCQRLNLLTVKFTDDEETLIVKVSDEIETRFDQRIPLWTMISDDLTGRRVRHYLYKELIRRIDPYLAVMTVSYFGRETFVEACRDCGVPTIELQHGIIDEYHMGYSFPEGTKNIFPDYFFAFGDFWANSVDLPLADERIYSVGYPHLEQQTERFRPPEPSNQVVVISQPSVGEYIHDFALELSRCEEVTEEIVFKLHPKEYSSWRDDYPQLVEADLTVVSDDPPMYEIFSQSMAQVGVFSTALYEGLSFGIGTYILDAPGSERVSELLDNGHAELIGSLSDYLSIRRSAAQQKQPVDSRYFFEERPIQKIEMALRDVSLKEGVKGIV